MKSKKILVLIIVTVLAIIGGLIAYFIGFKQDKNTTLTVLEKQWIEDNKTKLIDLSIINNIPMITYNGEGIFFDFLNDLENDTKLEFNKVAYNNGSEIKTEYAVKLVENIEDKQIVIYEDDYVLVTKNNTKINSVENINNIIIGTINNDLEDVNKYLNLNSTNSLKTYDSYEKLIEVLNKEEKEVDAIVLPRLMYFDNFAAGELNISYHISEMNRYYVLQLGNNDKLNDILTKYYKKWSNSSYDKSYQSQFLNSYLNFSKVDDKKKVEFKSKRYAYGFLDNSPYDYVTDGKYVGINHAFMAGFSGFAGVEISYKKYNDIDSLIKDFNENKLDVIFNNTTYLTFDMDVTNTVSTFDEKVAILKRPNNNVIINSVNSLIDKEVLAVKASRIADTLVKKGVNVKAYDNIKDLLRAANKNSIIVIDYNTYNYYSSKELKEYKVSAIFDLGYNYNFTVRKVSDNELFSDILNFYLVFNDEKEIVNQGYYEVLDITSKPLSLRKLVLYLIGIISIGAIVLLGIFILRPKKKKNKKVSLTKEDKLKYIDMLTSLKNRNYLNDNIENWDASEVYPQTIIIIDLNNVAYINDNYGHAEGDKVIGEAANVLITTQMPNSEIIRTNGNEFLIYMVGYDEKQVVSYIRKLNKEFKGLSHGFGSAIGYSMINDAIKTVDDAINEATAVMREIKEEINY